MSKAGYLTRYQWIVTKVRKQPYCTKQEIEDYIQYHYERALELNEGLKLGKSDRTLTRDIAEIRKLWQIDIIYDPRERGYYIANDTDDYNFLEMLDSFEIMNTIRNSREDLPYIFLDNKRAEGYENFSFILEAIKKKKTMNFTHQKYWEEEVTHKTVKPLALKEYKYRWYLIALDTSREDAIRTFGLDRMSDLNMTAKSFTIPKTMDIPNLFKHCFGIIYNEGEPEDIILSLTPFQAKYVKSLPMHSSQRILKETELECQIALKMYITFDFVQEILSLGSQVKVLEPKILAYTIKQELKKAVKNYE